LGELASVIILWPVERAIRQAGKVNKVFALFFHSLSASSLQFGFFLHFLVSGFACPWATLIEKVARFGCAGKQMKLVLALELT